jgi:hypothetical protein
MKRTPTEWLEQPEWRGIEIIDCDGWDLTNFYEPIGQEEFEYRLSQCTLFHPPRFFR